MWRASLSAHKGPRYELLVGALPFDAKALRSAGYVEMQRIIREQEPPKPSTRVSTLAEQSADVAAKRHEDPRSLVRRLQGDLDWICLKTMEKDRTRRYSTPLELVADTGRHPANEPVLACPPSLIYRLKQFVRKYRGPVAAAATVLAALVKYEVTDPRVAPLGGKKTWRGYGVPTHYW